MNIHTTIEYSQEYLVDYNTEDLTKEIIIIRNNPIPNKAKVLISPWIVKGTICI